MWDCNAWIVDVEGGYLFPCKCDSVANRWHTDNHAILECVHCKATWTDEECPF